MVELLDEETSVPQKHGVCYVELNGEVITYSWARKWGWSIQLDQGASWANLGRHGLCRGAVGLHAINNGGSYGTYFLCTLSISMHRQKGEAKHFPLGMRLGSLAWRCPHTSTTHIRTSCTQDFLHFHRLLLQAPFPWQPLKSMLLCNKPHVIHCCVASFQMWQS